MFAEFLHKFHNWKSSGFSDVGQNALDQSDWRIFKLTISLEQNNKKDWFFVNWCIFIEIKGWLKNCAVGVVKMSAATLVSGH